MSAICIVANSRAERGPLQSVIAALPEADVIGLSALQQSQTPAQVTSFGIWWFTREFEERSPRLVVLLGDRYETWSAAMAAMFLRIPIAHIHGGETTTGAWDDAIRDGITRMATLHFVATRPAWLRVAELQNSGARIKRVGTPGLDGVAPQSAKRDHKTILVTYHPETRAEDYGLAACRTMLDAVYERCLGYQIFFSSVNNDTGAADIKAAIEEKMKTSGGMWLDADHDQYVTAMQHAACVVGNSSAGIIEAPWIGIPTVNIGNRQDGRERAPGVFDTDGARENILHALNGALSWNGPWEPVYKGGAAARIAEICREFVG